MSAASVENILPLLTGYRHVDSVFPSGRYGSEKVRIHVFRFGLKFADSYFDRNKRLIELAARAD